MDVFRHLQGICFTEMESEAQQGLTVYRPTGRMYSHRSLKTDTDAHSPLPSPTLPQPWKAQELCARGSPKRLAKCFLPEPLTGREEKLEAEDRAGDSRAAPLPSPLPRPQPLGEATKDPRPVTTPSSSRQQRPKEDCSRPRGVLSIKCVGKIISLQPHGWNSSFRAALSALPGSLT